jgi:hypothetical protein
MSEDLAQWIVITMQAIAIMLLGISSLVDKLKKR